MSKYFIMYDNDTSLTKEEKEALRKKEEEKFDKSYLERDAANEAAKKAGYDLKAIDGRVVVLCNTDEKNWHTLENGTKLRRERQFNEFNRRISEPVNAIVIDGEGIPQGAELLIHHNSLHEVNKIYDYKRTDGTDVLFYSIPKSECFAWRDESGELQPMRDFQFALRVFKPYLGTLEGIDHELIKDVLYITTGKLKGLVCHVLKASDYEIIYQGEDGREARVIRIRHSDDDEIEREEVVAIDHGLTEKVNQGLLYIGLEKTTSQPIKNEITINTTDHQQRDHNAAT